MMDEQIKQLAEYAERLAELVGGDILSVKVDYYNIMDIFVRRKPAGITEYTKEKTADNDPVYTYYCESKITDNCKVSWFEHEEDNHETI